MLKLEFYELALTLLCIAEVRNTEVLLLKGGISKQEQEQDGERAVISASHHGRALLVNFIP